MKHSRINPDWACVTPGRWFDWEITPGRRLGWAVTPERRLGWAVTPGRRLDWAVTPRRRLGWAVSPGRRLGWAVIPGRRFGWAVTPGPEVWLTEQAALYRLSCTWTIQLHFDRPSCTWYFTDTAALDRHSWLNWQALLHLTDTADLIDGLFCTWQTQLT